MALLRQFSSDELSRSLHSAADKLGIEDFRSEQRDALHAFLHGQDVDKKLDKANNSPSANKQHRRKMS